jgi:hypothetical protein
MPHASVNADLVLRRLIIADVVFSVMLLAVGVFGDPVLVEPWRAYERAQREADLSARDWVLLPFDVLLLVLAVFAWTSLWRRHRSGRLLYTMVVAISTVLLAFEQPLVSSGATQLLGTAAALVGGAILALLYFSDLRSRYAPQGA